VVTGGFHPSFSETEKVRVVSIDKVKEGGRMKRIMQRMFNVQTMKISGPGFKSLSPEYEKARRKVLQKRKAQRRINRRECIGWSADGRQCGAGYGWVCVAAGR